MAEWRSGWASGAIERGRRRPVELLAVAVSLSRNEYEQVVHVHVPVSPSSTIWYWPKSDDALRLKR